MRERIGLASVYKWPAFLKVCRSGLYTALRGIVLTQVATFFLTTIKKIPRDSVHRDFFDPDLAFSILEANASLCSYSEHAKATMR